MTNIIKIGKLINILEFDKYIKEIDQLPEIIHEYGKKFDIPDSPCLMTYGNNTGGTISFTRHTHKHPILIELTKEIVKILRSLLHDDIPVYKERVHIIKTKGNVVAHRDEAGRNTCINIGLMNTSLAMTNTNYTQDQNYDSYILNDGEGYILNTHEYHSVTSIENKPRYLITYGFAEQFDYIKSKVNQLL